MINFNIRFIKFLPLATTIQTILNIIVLVYRKHIARDNVQVTLRSSIRMTANWYTVQNMYNRVLRWNFSVSRTKYDEKEAAIQRANQWPKHLPLGNVPVSRFLILELQPRVRHPQFHFYLAAKPTIAYLLL